MNIYSIKDIKVGVYNVPFFYQHDQQAVRQFMELCNDGKSMICKYPADFELWKLGSYEEESGTFREGKFSLMSGVAVFPDRENVQESLPLPVGEK